MTRQMKRWLYGRVVWLNDHTKGRYSRLQSRLWIAGWGDLYSLAIGIILAASCVSTCDQYGCVTICL